MSDARDRFFEVARASGIDSEPVTYPDGTRTAREAAAAIGCDVDQIVKSLVFIAEDGNGQQRPLLALTSGGRRVDVDALARLTGAASVRKADADEVRSTTGFAMGATPPFGFPEPVTTYLDPHLAVQAEVWAGAGSVRDMIRVTPDDLRHAGAAEIGDFTA